MSAPGPQLGITLYSLTLEYRLGKYTFEEVVRKAGEMQESGHRSSWSASRASVVSDDLGRVCAALPSASR